MRRIAQFGYQADSMSRVIKDLFVFLPHLSGPTLLPIGRPGEILFNEDYRELEHAEPGDMYLLRDDHLLHVTFTMDESAVMVERTSALVSPGL